MHVYEKEHLEGAHREVSTVATQRSAFNQIRKALDARELLEPLTPGSYWAWLRGRVERGEISETTANQYIKYLGMVFRYARNFWPFVDVRDVTVDMPRFKAPRREPRALAGEPSDTLARIVGAMPDALARAFVLAQAEGGLRLAEALGVHWEDIDLGAMELHVQRKHSANPRRGMRDTLKADAHHRTLPITQRLAGELAEVMEAARLRGEPLAGRVWTYSARGLAELMGICRAVSPESFPRKVPGRRGGLAWHAFRDTLGAQLAATGYSPRDGQKILGHGSVATTEGYFKNWRGDVTERELWQKAWDSLTPAERANILAASQNSRGGSSENERTTERGTVLRLVPGPTEQKGGGQGDSEP